MRYRELKTMCWFCGELVKSCEHLSDKRKVRLNKFFNFVNLGGNETTGIQSVNNYYTEYGKGYRDAIYDVYKEMAKAFKPEVKGLK